MRLRIVKKGVYNNRHHKAVACDKGDILHTTASYGKSLIDSGFAVAQEPKQDIAQDQGAPVGVAVLVSELGLSDRVLTGLMARGYRTVDDVSEVSDGELHSIVGIGKSTAKKIREWLEQAAVAKDD